MSIDIIRRTLIVLVLGAAFIPANLPDDLLAQYESKSLDGLINFGIGWVLAFVVLIAAYCLGPKVQLDESASLGDVFYPKHLPGNWRQIFFLVFIGWSCLLFLLTVAYISAYGTFPDL